MRRMIFPLMLFVVACQPATMELTEEDVAAIQAIGPALDEAALAKDVDGVVGLFTDDAVFMPSNAPIVEGRANFAPWIQSALDAMAFTEHVIRLTDVQGTGNFASARGVYSEAYVLEGATEPVQDNGKLLAALRKQPDGSWRISVWMFSSDLPLPSTEGEHTEGEDRS